MKSAGVWGTLVRSASGVERAVVAFLPSIRHSLAKRWNRTATTRRLHGRLRGGDRLFAVLGHPPPDAAGHARRPCPTAPPRVRDSTADRLVLLGSAILMSERPDALMLIDNAGSFIILTSIAQRHTAMYAPLVKAAPPPDQGCARRAVGSHRRDGPDRGAPSQPGVAP